MSGVTEPLGVHAVVDVFQRWLFMPDPRPLLAMLGAIAANRLDGDPVWLVVVGPPGGGKSELLQAVGQLPNVHPTATLTEAALLSGTPQKERANSSKGGLLREIGDFGIIVRKDFGSVLSMHRDARAQVLAALREIYDGAWTRHVGTDGGRTLHWSGKVGLVAGCTPAIDRHHGVMNAMGERFVLLRLPEVDPGAQAHRALEHAGHEREMRDELAGAVVSLFSDYMNEPPRPLNAAERGRLVALATLVVRCRSAVERDPYSREIEFVPGSEAPTRLVIVLERLLGGLDSIGVQRAAAWKVVLRVGLDSMPALRRFVVDALRDAQELPTPKVAEAVRHPTNTVRRTLQDLAGHGVVKRRTKGDGENADSWKLSDWARAQYDAADGVPEMSANENGHRVPEKSDDLFTSPLRIEEDISGTRSPEAPLGVVK